MPHKLSLLIVPLVFLSSCDSTSIGNLPIDSLEFYLESARESGYSAGEDVYACAAGGNSGVSDVPVSVYFFPESESSDYSIWETVDADANPSDLKFYRNTALDNRPLFQGSLRRFLSDNNVDRWVIVSYLTDGRYHLSNPIRIKADEKPTQDAPELVTVSFDAGVPTFQWQDGIYDDTAVYFEVVSGFKGDMLTGTYTEQTFYEYGNFANVTINLLSSAPPALQPQAGYRFTLMGVSADNWVNLFADISFSTP